MNTLMLASEGGLSGGVIFIICALLGAAIFYYVKRHKATQAEQRSQVMKDLYTEVFVQTQKPRR